MKKIIKNKTFDLERSLYGISDTLIDSCVFAGPADGESVLKECRNICVTTTSASGRAAFTMTALESTQMWETSPHSSTRP